MPWGHLNFGTRQKWVVTLMPWLLYPCGNSHTEEEAGWAPESVWTFFHWIQITQQLLLVSDVSYDNRCTMEKEYRRKEGERWGLPIKFLKASTLVLHETLFILINGKNYHYYNIAVCIHLLGTTCVYNTDHMQVMYWPNAADVLFHMIFPALFMFYIQTDFCRRKILLHITSPKCDINSEVVAL